MLNPQTNFHKITGLDLKKSQDQISRFNKTIINRSNSFNSDKISFIIKTYIRKDQQNQNKQIVRNKIKSPLKNNLNKQSQQHIPFKNLIPLKLNQQKRIQKEKRKEDYIKFVKRQIQKNQSNLLNTRLRLAAMLYGNQNKRSRYQNLKYETKNRQAHNNRQAHSNSCLDLILNNHIQLKQTKNNYTIYQQHRQNLNIKLKRKSLTSDHIRNHKKIIIAKKKPDDLQSTGILSARQIKLSKNTQDIKHSLWGNFKKEKKNIKLKSNLIQNSNHANVVCFQQAIHFKSKNNSKFKQDDQFNSKQINKIKLQAWQIQMQQLQESQESRFELISKIIH